MELIDNVGFFGPMLLFGAGIYALRKRRIYLIAYLVFFAFNGLLNRLLKVWIHEPRPTNPSFVNQYDIDSGAEKFGMPSGHAQAVAYSVVFIYMTTQSLRDLIGMLFVAALTLHQRWAYNRHTTEQLGAGSLVGSSVATIAFWAANKYIAG
jgi:membrane-associated phospholipid phosphatase